MLKKFVSTALLLGMCPFVFAQYAKVKIEATDNLIKEVSGMKPTPLEGVFLGFINPPSDGEWQPTLTNISRNESEDNELLEKIKEEKNKLMDQAKPQPEARTATSAVAPTVNTNFAGINNGGNLTPLDNTIAVSNHDTLVVFVNSEVAYYTSSGTQTFVKSLYNFVVSGGSIVNNLCDPKVIFDNVAKRFIFYVQVCDAVAADSKIVIGFSKSSNPADGWYLYQFSGNPLNNGCWWDYPKLGLSTADLFVTGNLFTEGSNTFNQAAIYQIPKAPCYAGAATITPTPHKWTGLPGSTTPFTILPLSYGQSGSYGPGIYLVSTAGGPPGGTSYKLYDITNTVASGTAVLNAYNVTSGVTAYASAGNAGQQGTTQKLNTGDCRSLDGFYLHGMIHFVFNKDAGSGFCGVGYNRLNVSSLSNTTSTFSNVTGTSNYAYPAIVSASEDSLDKAVLIAYNESSTSMFPRCRVVGCDVNMNWSAGVPVKDGAGYVLYPSSPAVATDRWGDYTGLAKKYGDTTGTAWMAGMYGNTSNSWSQWIAQIRPYTNVGVPAVQKEQTAAEVYPNPIVDNYHVKFDLPERQNIIINITDMAGKTVVQLYNNMAEKGENLFSFNKANLAPGVYSLNIIGAVNNIKNERIVITGK